MFTGIILAKGRIESVKDIGGDMALGIDASALDVARLNLGDSVSVQGVCLTVMRREGGVFFADVSRETLSKTTLGTLVQGSGVNLEPALRAGDALGGHLVCGHVDGIAELRARLGQGRSQRFRIQVPALLARYVARKGSVALDGVSVTVNDVGQQEFEVNLIPHTLAVTTLGELAVGDGVNIEVDLMARYAERLLAAQ